MNPKGERLLDFCAGQGSAITKTFFNISLLIIVPDTKAPWTIIEFEAIFVDTCAKEGADLSTDHQLVGLNLQGTGQSLTSVSYQQNDFSSIPKGSYKQLKSSWYLSLQ